VKGVCDDVQSGEISTINTALSTNLNTSTWETSFYTPSRALVLGGRGILIEGTLYLSDGTIEIVTNIAYSKAHSSITALPLVAGQSMETSSLSGWIGQANGALRRGTEPGLGTPIASIQLASKPTTAQLSEPVDTARIWVEPDTGKLYYTKNGTNRRYWIIGTEEIL
jgi:hypothetical protein